MRGLDKVIARIRAIWLLLALLQFICLCSAWSTNTFVGGYCDSERVVPYLQDVMLALQILCHLIVVLEHFCGYGTYSYNDMVCDDIDARDKGNVSRQEHLFK